MSNVFGNLVQKLQSLSPLTSPTTSPSTSPKLRRKFGFGKSRKKKECSWKDDAREVQSEPELEYDVPKKDRRKISAPVHSSSGHHRVKISVVNEPYPTLGMDAIYDVPANIRRRVEVVPNPVPTTPRRIEGSKTVGRVEGIRQVSQFFSVFLSFIILDIH